MITITDISFSSTGPDRFLLFHSFRQFFSYLVCVFVGISIVAVSGYALLGWEVDSGTAILMGFLGALPSVFLARQASFKIHGSARMQYYSALNDRLLVFGFEPTRVDQRETMYEKKLPKILRWDKSGVTVRTEDSFILVSGPYGTLLSLRKFLSGVVAR